MLRIVQAGEGKILLSNQSTEKLLIFGRWYVTKEAEYIIFQAIKYFTRD